MGHPCVNTSYSAVVSKFMPVISPLNQVQPKSKC